MNKKIIKKSFLKYFPILVIILGMFFRTYHLDHYPFGFDQVQIAEYGHKISRGDLSLIGPRTGPADMFTGPLIYYSAAIFNLFLPSHWAVVYNALFLSLITGLTIYFLARKYSNLDLSILIISLWSFSPFLIKLDRIPWNPNLMMLAGSLSFFPLLKKKLNFKDVILVLSGIFLGYQAHFSGLLLLPLVVFSLLIKKENRIWIYLSSIGSFLLSIFPTLVFDMRNSWFNTNGFINLIMNKDKVASYEIFNRLAKKLLIVAESCGKLFFENNQTLLLVFTGGFILLFFIYQNLRKYFVDKSSPPSSFKISILWLGLSAMALSLYRASTPEYYFLVIIPVLIFIMANFLQSLHIKPIKFSLIFFLFSWLSTVQAYANSSGFSLGEQLAALEAMRGINFNQGISQIAYDLDEIDALGFKYLLSQSEFSYKTEGVKLHLIYPYEGGFNTRLISDDVALWVDKRTQLNTKYYSTPDYIISYSPNFLFLSNIEVDQYLEIKIYDSQSEFFVGKIEVFNTEADLDIPSYKPNEDLGIINKWQPIFLENGESVYFQRKNDFIFILYSDSFNDLPMQLGLI